MPAFAEFVLVAIVLFLWESTLWLPLRSRALRRRWDGGWRVLDPGAWFAAREIGMIPLRSLPPDAGLAPCQAPPLLVDEHGGFLVESDRGGFIKVPSLVWDDLKRETHHLRAGGTKIRISSPRCVGFLHRAKLRGAAPEVAVRQAWRAALSPERSLREWRRWRLVSAPLRWYGLILTLGFFAGLPLAYVYLGSGRTLYFALWLWCVMALTAAHLWWLGKRVYPDAGAPLRMDALLALMVPFHAMRASEIAAVHAMGLTHPVGLIIATGDLENPWLGRFVRRILHPFPGDTGDAMFASALGPLMDPILARHGKTPADFDAAPDAAGDPDASRYCPRCHSLYQAQASTCGDCRNLELRSLLPAIPA